MKREFIFPIILTAGIYFAVAMWAWESSGNFSMVMQPLFTVTVLALLELSISFDNAVVNVTVLRDMSPIWQKRFLTWGILVAVFGMRILFPVLIVAIISKINPWQAFLLSMGSPEEYSRIMGSVHAEVSAFGGCFLALVALKYFVDEEKDTHWIAFLERPLSQLGRLESAEVGAILACLLLILNLIPETDKALSVGLAGLSGIVIWIAVETLGALLDQGAHQNVVGSTAKSGLASFLYLEVLDASFSFDGVIGALAISNQLLLIAAGLGIGALFVRAFTVSMLHSGILTKLRYLEHGAFYAVASLATMMLLGIFFHIHELVTGGIGISILALSAWASFRHTQAAHPKEQILPR